MDNNTVALSIVEDLIHWPLCPADPTDISPAISNTNTTSNLNNGTINNNNNNNNTFDMMPHDEAPLTAGAIEELDEETRERQQIRYTAVRQLPLLAQSIGSHWAKTEVIPYLLRCIEEEDAELSFAVGMVLMELITIPFTKSSSQLQLSTLSSSSQETRGGKLLVDTSKPFSLKSLLPVVLRMGASADAGVRLFLVEVVIPMLFFGVSLESSIDLREWELKYLTRHSRDGGGIETGDEPKIIIDTNGTNNNNNSNISTPTGNGISKKVWDPFQISLHANKLRSSIATFLRDVTADSTEVDAAGPMMASFAKNINLQDYINRRDRREAFRARWGLFIGLMESMLESSYPATVSAGVECIGNIFSSIAWTERAERRQESLLTSSILRSTEELVEFIFTTTRMHVGRTICSGAEKPCEDLIMLLTHHNLLCEGSKSLLLIKEGNFLKFGNKKNTQEELESPNSPEYHYGPLTFGSGGLSLSEREVWNICISGTIPAMHRIVRISLLRSLPRFINWTSNISSDKATSTVEWVTGLSFFAVCNVFNQVLTSPIIPKKDIENKGSSNNNNNNNNNNLDLENGEEEIIPLSPGNIPLLLESDVCHDFGIAEALLDGIQHLFDELLRPCTIEDFLHNNNNSSSSRPTLEEKEVKMMKLCELYRDCVLRLASLPSWRTRWIITQRLPLLTTSLIEILNRVGSHDIKGDGPKLVEKCIIYICEMHIEQWSSAQERDGDLKELVHDDEEEIRCVIALCAARVFRAIGQRMFRLVFPRGILKDLKHIQKEEKQIIMKNSSRSTVLSSGSKHVDPNIIGNNNNNNNNNKDALLSIDILLQFLPTLLDAILSCCVSVLRDSDERVRSGAAAGLSALARTLSTMVTVCELHVCDLGKLIWVRYLDRTTAALMSLLNDTSATVQLALVSELAVLLAGSAAEAGRLAATMGGSNNNNNYNNNYNYIRRDEAAHVREGALIACLQTLSRHEVWRYRARYATLLSEMCVKFLAPNVLAAAEAVNQNINNINNINNIISPQHGMHSLEESLRESSVTGGGRPSGVVLAEDGCNPLHRFAKEQLLPLLVDVLFDKVKAVRDGALESLVQMCDRLSAARLQLQVNCFNNNNNNNNNNNISLGGGGVNNVRSDTGISRNNNNNNRIGSTGGIIIRPRSQQQSSQHYSHINNNNNNNNNNKYNNDDDVFINDTLWPLILNSPKAMATYLSRSSLLRIAVRLGVDKESILLPLFDQLGHDSVLNVRLVVAKELFGILSASATANSTGILIGSTGNIPKLIFTEQEKNGVVLQLLRLLVEDKSADVRDEAARALKLCF